MTDEQMTRLCLEAMYGRSQAMPEFDPLKEDAHAMAMVKKLRLRIWIQEDEDDGEHDYMWHVAGSGDARI